MLMLKVPNILIGLISLDPFFIHSLNDKSRQVMGIRELNDERSNISKLYLESLEKWKQGQIQFDRYGKIQNLCR